MKTRQRIWVMGTMPRQAGLSFEAGRWFGWITWIFYTVAHTPNTHTLSALYGQI